MTARLISFHPIHDGWTKLGVAVIRLTSGQNIRREIEDHGRAVAVLPFDAERRCAILVRQLRAPMLKAAGEASSLEAPAGILDEADPADCARREAMEECGLRLGALEHVACCWTMPGISTERMDLFLAPYSADDRVGDGGGLAQEHEEIEVIEIALSELARMIDAGGLTDMKTLTLALSLRARHPDLFG